MKTKEQAQDMIVLINTEIIRLPERNIFGDSNADDIAEMERWKDQLQKFIDTGETPPDYDPVGDWLTEVRFSELKDLE